MLRKPVSLLLPCLVMGLVLTAPAAARAEDVQQLDTEITYVGERFWFTVGLPGIWKYGVSETEDAIQFGFGSNDDADPILGQTITVAEKTAFDTWPRGHSVEWAADAYRQWELDFMKSEGVAKGMYRLRDVKTGQLDLHGRHFFTFSYQQTFDNPFMSGFVNHAFLYLYFPDDYDISRKFYWIHFLQSRQKNAKGKPSLDQFHEVIDAFSLDKDAAPGKTTISWSSPDNEHIHLSAPEQQRSYYFNNNYQRQCFSFSIDSIWYPTSTPGIFIAGNQYDHGGIVLFSEGDLKDYEGEDLIARAATCQIGEMEQGGKARAEGSSIEPLACVFPNTVKWTTDVAVQMFGQTFPGKSVWYLAEVKPGWVAVVQAIRETNTGDDDMARELLEALTFSDDPECFSREIEALRN